MHRHAGVLDCFSSGDLKNAVAIAGLQLLSVEALGETEATAPSASAEFAEHWGKAVAVRGRRAFCTDHKIAICGLDVDRVVVHARQFQAYGVSGFGFQDFGVGNALGGCYLLL